MKNLRRILVFSSLSLAAILLSLIFFHDKVFLLVGNYLIVQDKLMPADVIHVIAGEDYRTDYAIQLYKQGYAKVIFFTGGWYENQGYNHGEHGQGLAENHGVPTDAIAFDDSSVTSTYSETLLLKAWIDQSPVPIHSVIVVSDPFHMRRARWTYRQILGNEVEIIMAPVPFEETPYIQQWWNDRLSRAYVKEEYLKFFYYIARYQLSSGAMTDWLASFDRE